MSLIFRAAQTLPPAPLPPAPDAPAPRPAVPLAGILPDAGEPIPVQLGDAALSARGLVCRDSQGARLAEEMRVIWRRLVHKWEEGAAPRPSRTRTVVVTSAEPGEGKTYIATNLALACGMQGVPVLLADADLFRPAVAQRLDLKPGPGLAELLADPLMPRVPGLLSDADRNLLLLGAGQATSGASDLLTADTAQDVVRRLETLVPGGLLLIDTPPVLAAGVATLLAEQADTVLMVVQTGSTRPSSVSAALDLLQGVKDLSMVLNRVPPSSSTNRFGWYYAPDGKGQRGRR